MAYKKKDLENLALEAIKADEEIVCVKDVIAELPCSQATFYNHKLEELESIKEALDQNKTKAKKEVRAKWRKSENATLQIAYYRLLSDDEENDKLNGGKQKIEHSGGFDVKHSIDEQTIKDINEAYDNIARTVGKD